MPYLERARIESLFTEARETEKDLELMQISMLHTTSELMDKVKRKRVLISSDFKSAFKAKHIFDVYAELN